MKLEDYNAETICRAVRLPGFVEEAWMQPRVSAVRVVLTPTFGNEVVITLVEKNGDVTLAVRAFLKKFWPHGAAPGVLPYETGECAFGYGLFQRTVAMFGSAQKEAKDDRSICLDGMGMEACLVTGGAVQTFDINAAVGGTPAELARKLIDWSWTLMEDRLLRNALAPCGAHVGREYTLKKVRRGKPDMALITLGAPADRDQVVRALKKVASRRYPLPPRVYNATR